MRLGVAAAVVGGAVVPGDIEIAEGRIAAVGVTSAGASGLAAPGFVDLQINGFDGVDFLAADAAAYAEVGASLARTGVTAYQPTLISSPEAAYRPALAAIAAARAGTGPRVLGAHLEGPFLSPKRFGAHDPAYIAAPDVAFLERLLALGPVTHVTVAPEEPGGLDLVSLLAGRGVTVAIGHSDADAATANAAFDRGARVVTHLYNAQRPFSARDPGIIGASLTREDVTVSLILDGVHVAREAVLLAWRAAPGRFAIVTDAIEAAGRPDGRYVIGDRRIVVADGAARLEDGTLAGSALTMDRAVRNLVGLGVPAVQAIDAATRVPARAVRRDDLGDLAPGMPADVVVLDDALTVRRTLVGGVEVFAA